MFRTFCTILVNWYPTAQNVNKRKLIHMRYNSRTDVCHRNGDKTNFTIKFRLRSEVSFITKTRCYNGFPEDIVRSVIRDKIAHFHKTDVTSAQKCPVYLRLPWLGDISDRFANQISACVRKCYFSSNFRVVFRTRTVLPSGRKDVLPPRQHSSALIYSFLCVCGLQYIERTNQRLDARIKHVPTKIRLGNYFADHINNTHGSSIAEHQINNHDCASSYSADLFTILSRSHSDFHLKVLETNHILTHKASLCKLRKCLLGLNLITI